MVSSAEPTSTTITTTITTTSTTSTTETSNSLVTAALFDHVITGFRTMKFKDHISQPRPWVEFMDYTAISMPKSFTDPFTRFRKNMIYFYSDYVVFLILILPFFLYSTSLSIYSNPCTMHTLQLFLTYMYASYVNQQPSESHQPPPPPSYLSIFIRWLSRINGGVYIAYWILLVTFTDEKYIFINDIAQVGQVLLYTLLNGLVMVFVHGALRVPADLLDEQDSSSNLFRGLKLQLLDFYSITFSIFVVLALVCVWKFG